MKKINLLIIVLTFTLLTSCLTNFKNLIYPVSFNTIIDTNKAYLIANFTYSSGSAHDEARIYYSNITTGKLLRFNVYKNSINNPKDRKIIPFYEVESGKYKFVSLSWADGYLYGGLNYKEMTQKSNNAGLPLDFEIKAGQVGYIGNYNIGVETSVLTLNSYNNMSEHLEKVKIDYSDISKLEAVDLHKQ